MESSYAKLRPNPEKRANCFSRTFFCSLLRLGYKRPLGTEDLYEVLPADESGALCETFEKAWMEEVATSKIKQRRPQLKRAVISVFGARYMMLGLVTVFEELIKIIQPLFMGGLIRYFATQSDEDIGKAYAYAAGVALCAMSLSVCHHPYFYNLQRIGMRIRVSCTALIFKKSLAVSSSSLRAITVGKIINVLSNDVARFDQAILFLHYIWAAPLSLVGFMILLYYTMGPSCFAGFACLMVLVPLQGIIGRQMGKFRRAVASCSDKRIGIMNEILNGIRVIKMYAWEQPFAMLVDRARMREVKKLRVQALFQALIMGLFYVSGKIIVLCAIVAYALSGNLVNAEVVFVASALFNSARLTVTLFLPFAIQFIAEAKVAFNRIEDVLLLEDSVMASSLPLSARPIELDTNLPYIDEKVDEEKKRSTTHLTHTVSFCNKAGNKDSSDKGLVEMVDYSAKWTGESTEPTIKRVNFCVKSGQLLVIVGPVGAGKSTILLSLMGETDRVEGRMQMHGRLAYVPQEAWVFSSSLRKNITFTTENFDKERYQLALNVCALKKDLDMMPNGDMTLVGDKGVSLSGGQRARLNLARAVYSNADVYLLDDPLSAVDSAVGRFIFERCISKQLNDKARILVTHQLQYLPYADHILVVKEGRIVASGTYKELQNLGENFTAIMRECEESYQRKGSVSSPPGRTLRQTSTESSSLSLKRRGPKTSSPKVDGEAPTFTYNSPSKEHLEDVTVDEKPLPLDGILPEEQERLLNATDEKLIANGDANMSGDESTWSLQPETVIVQEEEDRTTGSVSWKVYLDYFKAMGNACTIFVLVIFCLFVQALFNYSDWWLNVWTNEMALLNGSSSNHGNRTAKIWPFKGYYLSADDYLNIYSGLVVALVVLSLARSIVFRYMLTRSSFLLHSRMFQAILRTPLMFFDRNPIGRVLNRFSKDTGTMDELLAFVTLDFVQGLLTFLGLILVVCLMNPWTFIPTFPLVIAFIGVRHYYMRTARAIKRLEATTRSPIFSHLSATLNGLTTIRAYGAEHSVLQDFHNYQNVHSAAFCVFLGTSRWFAIIIDWLCAIFVAIVAFVSIITAGEQQPSGGVVGLSLFYAVSLMGFFQWIIRQSTEMESMMVCVERILEYSRLPPEKEGGLLEKLRSTWPEKGEIDFANVSLKYGTDAPDILHNLNFAIKAAEKVGIVGRTGAGKSSLLNALFRLADISGTITIDGRDIKTVSLRDLRKRISIIPQDPVLFIGSLRENLDPFNEFNDSEIWTALEQVELKSTVNDMPSKLATSMQEGGANLSIGQRQLVCLGRALLRKNKILVIDEATANVDLHTDALIQRTLREQFQNCTVLTIAHRLNTIMDSDRVMILEDGQLKEIESPSKLLQNPSGLFTKLVQETGPANAQLLTKLAEEAYKRRNQ